MCTISDLNVKQYTCSQLTKNEGKHAKEDIGERVDQHDQDTRPQQPVAS